MTKPTDPFLLLGRPARAPAGAKAQTVQGHAERAHSKFSASGADRWFRCPGSVELSEGQPDKSSPWAIEGTQAHEVLERLMMVKIGKPLPGLMETPYTPEMARHAVHAANVILGLHAKTPDSEVMVETRIYLDFIHPEMFGTFDGAVVDHFGTLHVFDYKYGQGHAVSPKANLQMIFYGIGLAHRFHWNFKRVRLWIIQPRIKGYEGPLFWDIPIAELRAYVPRFQAAVDRALAEPTTYVEGGHCHWCKAKSVCPLKREAKAQQAASIFSINPVPKGLTYAPEEVEEARHQEKERQAYFQKKADQARQVFGAEAGQKGRQETQDPKPVSEADWRKAARKAGRKVAARYRK